MRIVAPTRLFIAAVAVVLSTTGLASAQQPAPAGSTRYLAIGDSIAAGYKAQPATQGYTFVLYQSGVFAPVSETLFNNLSAVGATTADVLDHQVPQALIPAALGGFAPHYVTVTVGGNDLTAIHRFMATNPGDAALALFIEQTLGSYTNNLFGILQALVAGAPGVKVFVGNQYSVPEIEALLPGADLVLTAFNQATAGVVQKFPGRVFVVDVHGEFEGRRGLLLIERRSASLLEVHLTNAGHRAMAQSFADVIAAHK